VESAGAKFSVHDPNDVAVLDRGWARDARQEDWVESVFVLSRTLLRVQRVGSPPRHAASYELASVTSIDEIDLGEPQRATARVATADGRLFHISVGSDFLDALLAALTSAEPDLERNEAETITAVPDLRPVADAERAPDVGRAIFATSPSDAEDADETDSTVAEPGPEPEVIDQTTAEPEPEPAPEPEPEVIDQTVAEPEPEPEVIDQTVAEPEPEPVPEPVLSPEPVPAPELRAETTRETSDEAIAPPAFIGKPIDETTAVPTGVAFEPDAPVAAAATVDAPSAGEGPTRPDLTAVPGDAPATDDIESAGTEAPTPVISTIRSSDLPPIAVTELIKNLEAKRSARAAAVRAERDETAEPTETGDTPAAPPLELIHSDHSTETPELTPEAPTEATTDVEPEVAHEDKPAANDTAADRPGVLLVDLPGKDDPQPDKTARSESEQPVVPVAEPRPARRSRRLVRGVAAAVLLIGVGALASVGTSQNWFDSVTGHHYSKQDVAKLVSATKSEAFASGHTAGEAEGRAAGDSSGKSAGYASGKAAGYAAGKTDGYAAGKTDGYTAGQAAGFAAGKTQGYAAGQQAGLATGQASGLATGIAQGRTAGCKTVFTNLQATQVQSDKYFMNESQCP